LRAAKSTIFKDAARFPYHIGGCAHIAIVHGVIVTAIYFYSRQFARSLRRIGVMDNGD